MGDEGFTDPVVRCAECQKLLRMVELKKLGHCKFCGNRRVREVKTFNDEEREKLMKWGFEKFVEKFAPLEGVDDE